MPHLSTVERQQRQTMRLLRHYVEKLPIASTTAKALKNVSPHADQLPDRLEALASVDPTLAIRMLYLANHTFHAMPSTGITIGGLLAHVGAAAIVDGLTEFDEAPVLSPTQTEAHELWEHSLQVAAVASHLAICAPRIGLTAAEAYLAGLIHDAGRFIMLAAAPATYGAISDKEWRTGDELLAAESEVCGFNHTVLGWLGCRTWNFPDSLAAVNRFHHAWTELDSDAMSKRTKALVRIVGIADDLAFAWDEHQGDGVVVEQILRSAESYLKKVHGRDTSLGTASALDTVLRRAEAASLSS